MMGLLKRISNVIRSNVNDLIDQAEDPQKIIEQTIADMQAEEKKAKQQLVQVMALLKKTELELQRNQTQAKEWEEKAMMAVKAENDDLARKALGEKQSCDNSAEESRAGLAQQEVYLEELKKGITALGEKVAEAKGKKNELIARLNASKAKQRSQTTEVATKDHLADSSAFDTFDRMSEKISTTEAESSAMMELANEEATTEKIDADVDAMFKEQKTDDALSALKAKMDEGTQTASETNETQKEADAADPIEDELAKMRAALEGDNGDSKS